MCVITLVFISKPIASAERNSHFRWNFEASTTDGGHTNHALSFASPKPNVSTARWTIDYFIEWVIVNGTRVLHRLCIIAICSSSQTTSRVVFAFFDYVTQSLLYTRGNMLWLGRLLSAVWVVIMLTKRERERKMGPRIKFSVGFEIIERLRLRWTGGMMLLCKLNMKLCNVCPIWLLNAEDCVWCLVRNIL